jgi:hydrogenase maturation protease
MEASDRAKSVLPKTLVLGVGNLLLSDEGVGVHVARELMGMELPPGVSVIEGGTAGLRLLSLIQGAERLIVIDAVKGEQAPGEVYRFDMDEMQNSERGLIASVHSLGVRDVLDLCALTGKVPQTTVIGVEPKSMEIGTDLSYEVKSKVPLILHMVLQETKQDPDALRSPG